LGRTGTQPGPRMTEKGGMGRPIRFIPPNSVVEITCRTIQGRWLLRPSPVLNDLLLGVLGRAMSLHPEVRVHAFVFLSNHVHLLLSVPDGAVLASFMNHFNSNVAREAGRLHAWCDRLWGRRYRSIVVVDEGAQVQRLRYILAHGAKERLVLRPADWPGAACVGALTQGASLAGTWIDRTRQSAAPRADPASFTTRYQIELAPLPCWNDLDAAKRHTLCQDLVADIETTLGVHAAPPPPVLGADAVLQKDPHSRPETLKKTPAPRVHAATSEARRTFLESQAVFMDIFSAAAERLIGVNIRSDFPSLAIPPQLPWGPPPSPA
jgi:REP element-mobilizing transposase RayT